MTVIRVLDFECSSLTPDDGCVIEVGYSDVMLPARSISAPISYLCSTPKPLTPENRAIHHIMPTQLAGKPKFDEDALNDQAEADGVTCWAAHNLSYESLFWTPRLPALCTYKAALRAWPNAPAHSNSVLRYWLEDQGRLDGFNHAHATVHRAGPDSYVTAFILRALLDDGHTGKQMLQWSREPAVLPRCPVGKHKGKPWGDIDAGWLRWALTSDLNDDIKYNARLELERR